MELRKDPITRSWVVAGHGEPPTPGSEACPFCSREEQNVPVLLALPADGPAQVRVIPHPQPLYRIEGHPERTAAGIYDRMHPVGAHEIVIESADHARSF